MEWFANLTGCEQALIATTFTWLMTALGAMLVFFCKHINDNAFSLLLSGSAGIMLASTFFSLLLPAIDKANGVVLTISFVCGAILIVLIDIIVSHLPYFGQKGLSKRNFSLIVAVTMHNIPEGLSVGIVFGSVALGQSTLISAISLAIGIGLQNFPEGTCIAFPLRLSGASLKKSFFIGQLSGIVEIVAGVLGAYCVSLMSGILPVSLSFAAGAMTAVVCSELIPESFEKNKTQSIIGLIIGFAFMMMLDICLG